MYCFEQAERVRNKTTDTNEASIFREIFKFQGTISQVTVVLFDGLALLFLEHEGLGF